MKRRLLLILAFGAALSGVFGQTWIRTNQLGYLPASVKVAVYISQEPGAVSSFTIYDALTDKAVFRGNAALYDGSVWGMTAAARLDFSQLTEPGGYYILYGRTRSETFRVGAGVCDGTADFILNYIWQQRCGYNPFLADSCHSHDGMIVDHPTLSGTVIDVRGGYHDASDHLRYTATTSNSVYHMMFAYEKSPEIFGDTHNAAGSPGSNGIPDILDEVRWGLEWPLKMNPDSGVMYNHVADDRDHVGFRLPNLDKAGYGLGTYRPVYFVTGKPQGLARFKNRTEGVASTAGKFASVFAMGAKVFRESEYQVQADYWGTLEPFTPGTGTNADYTTPEMTNYRSSEDLVKRLAGFEESAPEELNGSTILIHPGTDPARTDKLYMRLQEIIDFYTKKGYKFIKL